ncbi:MAG: hypothetical protein WCA89_17380 [Terracidiphilus sp.]
MLSGEKAAISDQRWLLFGEKPDFSGDFQGPNLTMRENWGAKSFPQALISNGLEIICKVFGGIYTPLG